MKYLTTLFTIIALSLSAQTGTITGVVLDASNNEPIPFANVLIFETSNGTTTDFDGKFTLNGIEPGFVQCQVSYIGYETFLTTEVLVSNNSKPFIEIKLEANQTEVEAVVIKVDRFKKVDEAPLSMQSIGTKEIESNPGANRDISKVIQSFPGVGSTPAFRNDIIIRGGGPSENRFYLDKIEIPILNHFSTQGASGGPVGIINADFVKSVNFYAGSFPANTNNALSGVLDFKLKEGSRDKTNFQIGVGASEGSITVDGPIGKNTSYIVSYRRSYLEFLFAALQLPFLPTFNDYQIKLKTKFKNRDQFTFISLGSLDNLKINTKIKDPDLGQQFILNSIPVNNQWSYTLGGVYTTFFDKGSQDFILSRNMLNNELYKFPENDESRPKIYNTNSREIENKFRYEYNFRDKGYKVNFSTNLEYAQYTNATQQNFFINKQLQTLEYKSRLDLFKYGISAQGSKRFFNERFLVSIGLRMDGTNYNDHMKNLLNQLSPRAAVSYALFENTKINAGFGRYFQLPAYTTLGFRNDSGSYVNQNDAKYIGSNHYTLGFEQRFGKSFIWTVEGFFKDYFQYPIDKASGASVANQGADFGILGASDVQFSGKGSAYGGETLLRVNWKKLNVLASYTFVRSLFTDINDKFVPSSWDSQHLISITGTYDLPWNLRAGFKWRFVGGLPYTPYADESVYENVEIWNANGGPLLDFDQLNAERNKAFHQLDLRVDKNFFFKKWSLMLYLDIQNAYNFQNKEQDYVIRAKNPDGSYQTTENGSKYVFLQNTAAEPDLLENKGGTILPTIGIMIKI